MRAVFIKSNCIVQEVVIKKNWAGGRIEKLWGRRPGNREIEEPEIKTEGVRIKKLWSRWGRFASPGRAMDGS